MDKRVRVCGIIVIFILLGTFFYIKYASSGFIESLYAQERFDVLNMLAGADGSMPLEFYLGRITETVWGPFMQVVSASALCLFALLFLQDVSALVFGLVIFGYLLFTKFEVLWFPFYGDAVGGVFAEAWWLAGHHFDYAGLLQQAGYAQGGPKVYVFSLYPTYLALLLTLISNTKVFLAVNHALVFLMGAGVIALMRKMLARAFSKPLAVMGSLILLYLAVFQSQVEAINMEMPCVLFLMLCADALMEYRIHRAGLMAVLAVLAKGTGIYACAAFGLIAFGLLLSKRSKVRPVVLLLWTAGLVVFAIVKVWCKFLMKDQHVGAGMVNFFAGLPSLEYIFITKVLVFSIVVLLLAAVLYRMSPLGRKLAPAMTAVFRYPFFVAASFVVMWFLLFLNFCVVSPRYHLTIYPFLLYVCFCAFYLLSCREGVRRFLAFAFICLAAFSSYGFFTGTSSFSDQVILERSLEYRNDLIMKQKLCHFVEDHFDRFNIMAPFTIAQMLAIPEAGYVHKHLDVFIYGFRSVYAGIKTYPGAENLDLSRSVFVGLRDAKIDVNFPYPVDPHDIIIRTVQYGNKSAHVFMGGVAIERMYRMFYILQARNKIRNGKTHARTQP